MAILKVIEILADSKTSWEDATRNAVKTATKSVKNIRSVFVQNQSATVENGEVKITFEVK